MCGLSLSLSVTEALLGRPPHREVERSAAAQGGESSSTRRNKHWCWDVLAPFFLVVWPVKESCMAQKRAFRAVLPQSRVLASSHRTGCASSLPAAKCFGPPACRVIWGPSVTYPAPLTSVQSTANTMQESLLLLLGFCRWCSLCRARTVGFTGSETLCSGLWSNKGQ